MLSLETVRANNFLLAVGCCKIPRKDKVGVSEGMVVPLPGLGEDLGTAD